MRHPLHGLEDDARVSNRPRLGIITMSGCVFGALLLALVPQAPEIISVSPTDGVAGFRQEVVVGRPYSEPRARHGSGG